MRKGDCHEGQNLRAHHGQKMKMESGHEERKDSRSCHEEEKELIAKME